MSQEEGQILLVDPETEMCSVISCRMSLEGVQTLKTDRLSEVWPIIEKQCILAIISEVQLPDGSGFELLTGLAERNLNIPVIFLTAYGNVEWAKEAIRRGAFEYYDKPVDLTKLSQTVREALRKGSGYEGPERRQFAQVAMENTEVFCRDELTGLASHRFVLEKLPVIHEECRKQGIPLTLCMIDIEDFKKFNNNQGLSVGDLLLMEVARRLRRIVRTNDIVSRYGGDEFLLVLPGADQKAAQGLSERIKKNFKEERWQMVEETMELPLCIGISEVNSEDIADFVEFLDRAIEAVYHAKLQGPGSVVTWNPQLSREATLMMDSHDQPSTMPDYESINIMMWRFRELNRRLSNVTLESLRLLVAAVEARDPYTKHHSVRVASFSRYIAEELGLPDRQIRIIHSAALLHDIGKIGIPDAILTKPERLTDQETELIHQHPVIAVNILEQARFFVAELPLVRHHHEWVNGKGYPDALAGQNIPVGARIIQVADATEAMLARRSYKGPYELDKTIRQIREGAGRQFDTIVAETAIKLIQDGMLERLWRNAHGSEQELSLIAADSP